MESREAEIGKMEKQLQAWGSKLDELAAKASDAGAKAKADEREFLAELKVKQANAQAKLSELRAAGADKWETVKAGAESAYKELAGAFKKITN
jgi:hypothetical protein